MEQKDLMSMEEIRGIVNKENNSNLAHNEIQTEYDRAKQGLQSNEDFKKLANEIVARSAKAELSKDMLAILSEEQKNELTAYMLECEKGKLAYRKKQEKKVIIEEVKAEAQTEVKAEAKAPQEKVIDSKAHPVMMPKQGITVESCILTKWNVKVGDKVKVGDILFSYETDKSAFDQESEFAGEVLALFYEEGDEVVAVENGSAGETVARTDIGATKLVERSDGQVGALSEVLAGTADVAIIDITMAQSVVGKADYSDLMILEGASYGDEIFAVGLRKDSNLKAKLDAFLKAKYADGTITDLAAKYEVGINEDALK